MATGDQQITESSQAWTESPYRFTQPVRLFKANDPYYWEVDNLPLEQLEENILWLKDQVGNSTFVSGVGRSDLAELKPFANGASRSVFVQPGRYTARINDAYNKGIGSKALTQRAVLNTQEREGFTFTYTDEEIRALLGDSTNTVFLNNGLYDHLQHHNSESTSPVGFLLDWRHGYSYFTENNKGINEVANLPKNKLALWKKTSSFPSQVDLQQAATEFTRVYGGAIRTSVVNVAEQMSISIPEFDVDDHRVGTTAQPQVRVDLLFIYSHPIDASSTTLPSPNGSVPTEIFEPRLGLLKGAGVVAVSAVTQGGSQDLTNTTGYVDSVEYGENSGAESFRLDMGKGVDENSNYLMNAVASDQLQNDAGIGNVYASFPSPDDVMNLAPMFAEQIESGDNQYNLIGQSILPVAYVFVKRNKAVIEQSDLVDIRPFFRTTELAYNERAGIAAASPPLSFANPAVGKQELRDSTYKAHRDMLDRVVPLTTNVNSLLGNGRVLAKGMIFGGTKWGVEGAYLAFMQRNGLFNTETSESALAGLKEYGHVPADVTSLPLYPGWDINHDYFDDAPGGSPGSRRNDRLHSAIVWGNEGTWQRVTPEAQLPEAFYEWTNTGANGYPQWVVTGPVTYGADRYEVLTTGSLFVKKDIDFPPGFIDAFTDYDVAANLHGSVLMTNPTSNGHIMNLGASFGGLTVQKRGKKGITIIVGLGHPAGSENNPFFAKPNDWNAQIRHRTGEGGNQETSAENYVRDLPLFSRVMPLSQEMVEIGTQQASLQTNTGESMNYYHSQGIFLKEWECFNPVLVTYPTVEFTITGYQGVDQTTNFFSITGTGESSSTLNTPSNGA